MSAAARSDRAAAARGRAALLAVVVCTGYLTLGRPFAYVGVPQLNLYLAEMTLAGSVIWRQGRQAWRDFFGWLMRGGPAHLLAWTLTLNLAFGVIEFLRGVASGGALFDGLKELTLNYSPFFVVLGVLVARWSDDLPRRIMISVAWVNATYGIIQVFALNNSSMSFPGQAGVPLFDLSNSAAAAIVWLAMYPRSSRYTWLLLPLNAVVLLGHQVRAEWTALVVGILVWVLLTRQARRLIIGLVALAGVLTTMWLAQLTIPASATRGGNISAAGIIGRSISPVFPSEAAKLVGSSTASATAGTAQWRLRWWHAIGASADSNPSLGLLGHGYGYQLSSLTTGVTDDVRTPHDIYYYTLGYTGYFGVVVLGLMWAAMAALLFRARRAGGSPYGLVFFAICLTMSLTSPWFETPIGATPTYLFLGICMAPALARRPPLRGGAVGKQVGAPGRAITGTWHVTARS